MRHFSFRLALVATLLLGATAPPTFLLTLGDSLVAGGPILAGSPNWTQLLQTRRVGARFSADNAGVGGYTVLQAQAVWDSEYEGRGYTYGVLLVGTNALASAVSGSTVCTQITTLAADMTADGLEVAVCTIPPRGGSASWDGTKETQRLAANTCIRAMTGVTVVDLETALGGSGDPLELNASYRDADKLHLNGAGQPIVADAIDDAVSW